MSRRLVAWSVFVLLAVAGGCHGCSGCGHDDSIAKLATRTGRVDRDFASTQKHWQSAAVGDGFSFGDGLRTGPRSEANVRLSGGARMRLEHDTTIRFMRHLSHGAAGTTGIDVQTGRAVVEAGSQRMRLQTTVGMAIIDSGGRLRLEASDKGLHYTVEIGAAHIEAGGKTTDLTAGQDVVVDIGGAIIEAAADAGQAAPSPPPDAGREDAGPGADQVVATVHGRGVTMRGPGEHRWSPVASGASPMAAGTELRVPRRATVGLARGDEQATLTGAGRYVVGATGHPLVHADDGRVSVQAGSGDVRVEVPGGVIVARSNIEGGSVAEANVRKHQGTAVRVVRGKVTVETGGESATLAGGETASVRPEGGFAIDMHGPDHADFFVTVGESFTVRDPRPPTAVGFRFGSKCSGVGVLEMLAPGGHRPVAGSRGTGKGNLLIPPGRHAYQLRCVGDNGVGGVVAHGVVRVVHDSGLARLPRTPPATLVDTDGRHYTVLYQNLLPVITVRWPNAPSASSYTLRVDGNHTDTDPESQHHFAPGEMTEGTHHLQYEVRGAPNQHSRQTTLAIHFDNAAPKASVREPENGSFHAGQTIQVSGVALAGWAVSVHGKNLPLDAQQRFSGQVTVPGDQTGIAIRIAHPARGVHYYVRRVAGGGG